MKKKLIYGTFSLLLGSAFIGGVTYASSTPANEKAKTMVSWGYTGKEGAEHWAELSDEFKMCGVGKKQSPINIDPNVESVPARDILKINYTKAPLEIIYDGLTQLNIEGKSILINDGHTVQLNFPTVKETVVYQGKEYRLIQLHFHTPSENHLNNQVFPFDIHFVHQGSNGKLAVIGVFIKEGKTMNPALQEIINNIPEQAHELKKVKNIYINPAHLLPANRSLYKFSGSLTTPPCSENVTWLVMAQPIEASQAQISALKNAVGETNARPIQAFNDRKIQKIEK